MLEILCPIGSSSLAPISQEKLIIKKREVQFSRKSSENSTFCRRFIGNLQRFSLPLPIKGISGQMTNLSL